jgi:NAD(P)H-hydrate epimerase
VAAHVVEPVFLPLPESGGSVTEDALPVVRAALGKSKACVAGPGLGLTSHTVEFMRGLIPMLAEQEVAAVLDADALNAVSQIDGWYRHAGRVVITPHPGEMSRLTGLSIAEIQADRLGVARRHAASWGLVVVLKGAGTVVAAPDGRASINPTGGPNLATAGTGDVLSGIISGLLAQGMSLYDAAVCGVYLHGKAGDLLRDEWGNVGTIAGDLVDVLPDARIAILQESEVDG